MAGKISNMMDIWADPNRSPFMAVTAHWIQAIPEQTNQGVRYKLCLRADLIGFQSMPGRHTGPHLAEAFIQVLDCVNIVTKVCIRLIIQIILWLTLVTVVDWLGHCR